MAKVAYLGTGLLGAAFAEAAARRGDQVVVWNRSIAKARVLAQFGIEVAETPEAAVKDASRVHLVLKDDTVVNEVIAQALPGLHVDAIILDHSTTLPSLTAERAAQLAAAGVKYLHCPVFMGPAAARHAQGSILVAGPEALFTLVSAELAKMTNKVRYLGERSDLAAVNKLMGNEIIISLVATLADILTLAQACDTDGAAAIEMLSLLDLNGMVATRGLNMAKGDFSPSFELAMARKDVRLMMEASADLPLAVLPAIAQRMDQLIEQGHSAADLTALAMDVVRRH